MNYIYRFTSIVSYLARHHWNFNFSSLFVHYPKPQVPQVHHCAVQSDQQSGRVPFAFPGHIKKKKKKLKKKNQLIVCRH